MKALLFGATGMVGQGVLRECLLDPGVDGVLTVGRNATGQQGPKLREVVVSDLLDLSAVDGELTGLDACFFCLGISSAGMAEDDYRRITYDIPMAAARTLSARNPGLTFVHVSGAGADSTEQGRTMWARIKGQAENALLQMPFKAVCYVTTTEQIGRAMIAVARHGAPKRVLENADINAVPLSSAAR